MSSNFYKYNVLTKLTDIEDIFEFSNIDTDMTLSFEDDDKILGNGCMKYVHAANDDLGSTTLNMGTSKDISDYEYLFFWCKMTAINNTYIKLLSTTGNYDVFEISQYCTAGKWKKIKIDLSSPDSSTGTFDNENLTSVELYSSVLGHTFYIQFIVFGHNEFVFDTDETVVLQGLGSGLSIRTNSLNVAGKNGNISVFDGTDSKEFDIPCFLIKDSAFQNLIKLQNLANKGFPILFELEDYLFYPIMIDSFGEESVFRETTETTTKTRINLTINAHVYNN